jgi:hypothetical protein
MLTSTEMMSAMLERVMDELYARGMRALPPPCEGEILFSRDASTTARIVAMVLRFYGAEEALKAFTSGAPCLSDKFDTVSERVCAVENFAFGGAKAYAAYLEHFEAHTFVSDHKRWPTARVRKALPKFARFTDRIGTFDEAAFEAHPEYRALHDAPDSTLARERFLNGLARRHLEAVHREVKKFGRGKGIGLEDPVFAAAAAAEEELRALAASGHATLFDYFNVLDRVVHAEPRFAKLAFGRGAMWALIQEGWEELCEWAVFFVRRLQMARNPDLAFTFLTAATWPAATGSACARRWRSRTASAAPTRSWRAASCSRRRSPPSRASRRRRSRSRPRAGWRGSTAACRARASC